MAQLKFNENGDLVNVESGEVVGNIRTGAINFSSANSQVKSLEEMGFSEPEIPDQIDDEEIEEDNKENDDYIIPMQEEKPIKEQYKEDKLPSSFRQTKSKYEINSNTHFIVKFGLYQNKDDGRFIPIRYDLIDEYVGSEPHWVKFRMWNYKEELRLKHECTEYHSTSRSQIINTEKLNEKKIKRLMLDWSFGEYDDRLKLLHCDGILSDESYVMFTNMYPSIANTIVDLMNSVLESNQ